MEFSSIRAASSWPFFLSSPLRFSTYYPHQNYVHWTETPDSHLFSANLPGVRKEEIRVEVEDSLYLIIRTEEHDDDDAAASEPGRRTFMRKFRLPEMVDLDRISAGYEDGVLTVTVPRSRRQLRIDPAELGCMNDLLAPAA